MNVAEHRRRRFEFVKRLYEATEGRTLNVVSVDELAAELGWSDAESSAVVEYLDAEGLIEYHMGNQASITHTGVVEVEAALKNPSRPTEHFPAVNLVLVQGSVVGSQIQAGATDSEQYQEARLLQEREGITQFLTELRNVLATATWRTTTAPRRTRTSPLWKLSSRRRVPTRQWCVRASGP